MAGYREHITVSGLCGVGYGTLSALALGFTPTQGAIAGCLTWIGGMLPDLDAQRGKPVQELTALVAAVGPMLAVRQLVEVTGSIDATILAAMLLYAGIRYGGTWALARFSVHRGMFHSVPALIIAAEIVFLAYKSPEVPVRILMAGGIAVGFFSHLLLDELYSVQWRGIAPRLAKSAGTAIKFFGPRFAPNAFAYGLMMFLTYGVIVKTDLLTQNWMVRDSVGPTDPSATVEVDGDSNDVQPREAAKPKLKEPLNELDRIAEEFGPKPL
ncbi:metal-dependent hydrolase [Calycomorphotria hydatis]|uniref:Metal-dependent hydrolase n=1 Tax=Calycomorphotria hydatis TaxID=2528027 RepID=A0A517T9I5_9PLAN|nr:metal-dependent hydrolase [Calycomorphotria hydatis]QDT65032.1 hypothetical protein V22_22780 [Calycomorphotria hydatis]